MGLGWKNFHKVKGRSSGLHPYTSSDMKRIAWCMKKGIKIAVIPHWKGSTDEWRVELSINKIIHLDPKIYEGSEANEKMYEYYKYYYDKNTD